MKYGVITYARTKDISIGDSMMSLGVREIYKKMGVKDEDIINVYFGQDVQEDYENSFLNYEGEYVILPMAMAMDYDNIRKDLFPLSRKIIPVFIGFTTFSRDGYVRCLHEYKQYGPFGCRDLQTMYSARQEGLDAYMLGCLSVQSVERREETDKQKKCYLVNVPEKLKAFMPRELSENVVEVDHQMEFDSNLSGKEAADKELEVARNLLNEYRDNAKLVVTSKLHCALPCISMGIPTIVVKWKDRRAGMNFFDHRFTGLDKFMNIYNYDEFDQIDWYPPRPDIEAFKQKQLETAMMMIKAVYNKYNRLCEISDYFEGGKHSVYYSGIELGYLSTKQKEDFIKKKTRFCNLFELIINRYLHDTHFVIYGAGDKGKWIYWQFKNEISMSKSCFYIDNDKSKHGKQLNNLPIYPPEELKKYKKNEFVVIIATNHSYDAIAQEMAKNLSREYDLEEGKNFFMLDKLMKSAEYKICDFSMVRPFQEDIIWNA